MPDSATLFLSAIEDQEYKEEKIGFWDDVYGFDYSCIKDIALKEPLVDTVELKSVVCDPAKVLHLDLTKCTKEDLAFKNSFQLTATRNDCELRHEEVQGRGERGIAHCAARSKEWDDLLRAHTRVPTLANTLLTRRFFSLAW